MGVWIRARQLKCGTLLGSRPENFCPASFRRRGCGTIFDQLCIRLALSLCIVTNP
jgi:hypothetical protein